MAYAEDVNTVPPGWKVRTIAWPSGHEVRLAFPPGRRKRGSGRLIQILHPHGRGARNPGCAIGKRARNTFKSAEAKAAYVAGLSQVAKGLGRKLAAKRAARGGAYYHGKPFRYTNLTSAKKLKAQIDWMEKRRDAGKDPSGRALSPHYLSELGKDIDRAKRLLDRKQNPGIGWNRGSRKNDGNGTEDAAKLYRQFHGHDPKEIIKTQVSAEQRKDYTVVGPLEDIEIVAVNGRAKRLSYHSDKVLAASSPNGKQLYFIGGNQRLPDDLLQEFGADPAKDLAVLGMAAAFTYWDRKKESQWKLVEWRHELGEESGEQPVCLYDRLQERVFFAGGTYYLKGTWVMN
jgi:hypothetical protein